MSEQTVIEHYRAQATERLERVPYLTAERQSVLDRLLSEGMPGPRSEGWRYADTKAIRKTAFSWVATPASSELDLEPLPDTAGRIVLSNGGYCEESSDLFEVAQAITIRRLANHLEASGARVAELESGVDGTGYLNTALLTDGMVLVVPTGVEIDDPIEVVHVMCDADGQASHPRLVIEMGEAAKITIIERFVGDDSAYWINAVTQVRGSESSHLTHIRLQEAGSNAVITSAVHARLGAEAQYDGFAASLGAASARLSLYANIVSEGSRATMDGVALAGAGQVHDAYTHIKHQEGNATSDQVFRTVAAKRGKTSFTGKVTVAVDAQETEADQSFKALLLDRTGEANAKPELEILADDVKCSHGATVGELDEKALFYLTSRGIAPEEARRMLVEAFLGDAMVRIADLSAGEYVQNAVASWMAEHVDA